MQAQFQELGLEVQRFNAIQGSTHQTLLKGEVGCLASHTELLRLISISDWDKVLILEDDAMFIKPFNTEPIPLNWDMLYLGGSHLDKPTPINSYISRITRSYTTHAYGITKDFATKVVSMLTPDVQIDVQYSKLHKDNLCYTINPSIAMQRPGFSDIQGVFKDYGV